MAQKNGSRHRARASMITVGTALLWACTAGPLHAQESAPLPRAIAVQSGQELPDGLHKLMDSWSHLGNLSDIVLCGSRKSLWLAFPTFGKIAELDSRGGDFDEFGVQLVTKGQLDSPVACAADAGELVLLGRRAVWIVNGDEIEDKVPLPFVGKSVADVSGDIWVSTVPALPVPRGNRALGDSPPPITQQGASSAPPPMLIRLGSSGNFDTLETYPEQESGEDDFSHSIAFQYTKAPLIVPGRTAVYTVDPMTLEIKKYSKSGTFKGILHEPSTKRGMTSESPEEAAAVAKSVGIVPDDQTSGVVVKPAVVAACWWEDHILLLDTASDPGGATTLSVVSTNSGDLVSFSLPESINPFRIAATRDLVVMWTFAGAPAVIDAETLEEAIRAPADAAKPALGEEPRGAPTSPGGSLF